MTLSQRFTSDSDLQFVDQEFPDRAGCRAKTWPGVGVFQVARRRRGKKLQSAAQVVAMLLDSFHFTNHARRRAHQRAARADAIEIVLRYADLCVPVGDRCECLSLTIRALSAIPATEAPAELRERAKRLAIVIDPAQDKVVTVLWLSGSRARRYRRRFAKRRSGARPAGGEARHNDQARVTEPRREAARTKPISLRSGDHAPRANP